MGFVIPLAAQPEQCYNTITPHSMQTSKVCGASGTFLLLGGWAGIMWVFLRSVSLHLQICWQVLVGKNFMIFAQAAGWGVPILGIILALVFSGVSFRFGALLLLLPPLVTVSRSTWHHCLTTAHPPRALACPLIHKASRP